MLFQLVQTRPEPIPLLNLAWICWFGQQTAPIAALLGRAMVQLCDPEFVSTSLAEFGDFVLPMGFCSFALEWERQAELPPLARWPARQRLLIWNGLLLQSQLCARQNPALALPYIESACGLLPELPDAWLLAAQFRLALDQPAAAARDLNQGLTCGGLFPWVYQALIRLALNRQDLIEARQLLAAARTLFHGPGTESVRAQLDALGLELSLAQNPRAGFA
ncbi:MAG: hypothetical protein CVV27_06155 [Candidatus Melainabacteria bacterium HGW-Melainabacteria-1]|nr:MAG: hypothetical protein CVV27_06155 [Candidatus Melainabacteria bacterium HGW-Melainabacteria-1]